jgi:hypothetical protein
MFYMLFSTLQLIYTIMLSSFERQSNKQQGHKYAPPSMSVTEHSTYFTLICHFDSLTIEFLFVIRRVETCDLGPMVTGSTIHTALHRAIDNRPIKHVSYTYAFY